MNRLYRAFKTGFSGAMRELLSLNEDAEDSDSSGLGFTLEVWKDGEVLDTIDHELTNGELKTIIDFINLYKRIAS